jgi:hypothetical protein
MYGKIMDKPAKITIQRLVKENLDERYCLQIGVEKRSTFIVNMRDENFRELLFDKGTNFKVFRILAFIHLKQFGKRKISRLASFYSQKVVRSFTFLTMHYVGSINDNSIILRKRN